jgi:membrane-bound serine protease (ClpP class)
MDTPGGLDSAMREIIKAILASPVPLVTFIAPGGARAASAGTYILYASHIAAMAPATNLGAATPVQIGGLPGMPKPGGADKEEDKEKDKKDGEEEKDKAEKEPTPDTAMERKLVNDAAAYIRSLAKLRGRNADWAEQAVRAGSSLSAEEALEQKVIDLMAADVGDLMKKVNGRTLTLGATELTLDTSALTIERYEQDWRNRLLSVITNPNVAYILMLLGVYGLIIEFSNPGYVLPGVVGTISLLLALYAFQVLPINYAGVALILVGIAFMVGEAFLPSFGALGLGGLAAFVFGSIILVDEQGLSVSIPLIAGTALVSAGFFVWVMGMLLRVRRGRVVSGQEELLGSLGEASVDFSDGQGRIWVHSESWIAAGNQPISRGQKVRVTGIEGLTLKVEPTQEEQ